jgi:hypothetical protein
VIKTSIDCPPTGQWPGNTGCFSFLLFLSLLCVFSFDFLDGAGLDVYWFVLLFLHSILVFHFISVVFLSISVEDADSTRTVPTDKILPCSNQGMK